MENKKNAHLTMIKSGSVKTETNGSKVILISFRFVILPGIHVPDLPKPMRGLH